MDKDGFIEVGETPKIEPVTGDFSSINNPTNDPEYNKLLKRLQGYHLDLLREDEKLADNPVLAGEYQGKLRLDVSRLFAYMNAFIDLQVSVSENYAKERERIYKEQLALGKSPSAAVNHAGEVTRILSSNVAIAKLRVDQIKNEYDRYNSIAIYLATRMKEFATERFLG